ncbi:MAG: hypothetical protein AAF787_10980 [Chloroflexota bacterium]
MWHNKSLTLAMGLVLTAIFSMLTISSVFAQLQPDQIRTPGAIATHAQATAQAVQANAQATAQAVQGNVQATGEAIRGNAQGTATAITDNIQSTSEAVRGNAQGTATAITGNVQATVDAVSTNIPATADALSTRAALTIAEYQSTADAVRTAVPEQIQELTREELEALLNSIDENLAVDFTDDGLTVTYAVSEAQFNTALDAALAASGYSYSAAAADFTPDGILITIEDLQLTENLSGRAVALVAVAAVNGEAQATVIFLTINDIPVPDEQVARVNAAIQAAADSAIDSILSDYEYSVDALYTTDTSIVTSISVPYDVGALAQE